MLSTNCDKGTKKLSTSPNSNSSALTLTETFSDEKILRNKKLKFIFKWWSAMYCDSTVPFLYKRGGKGTRLLLEFQLAQIELWLKRERRKKKKKKRGTALSVAKWRSSTAKTCGWHYDHANFGHLVAFFSLWKTTNKQLLAITILKRDNPPKPQCTSSTTQEICLELQAYCLLTDAVA